MSRFRLVAMFILITAAVLLPVSDARADTKWGCPVVYVLQVEDQVAGGHWPRLQINCSGDVNAYHAYTMNTPACSPYTVGLDTMKGWLSIFQAALLSKKNVDMTYNEHACGRIITGVALSGY